MPGDKVIFCSFCKLGFPKTALNFKNAYDSHCEIAFRNWEWAMIKTESFRSEAHFSPKSETEFENETERDCGIALRTL